MGTASSRLLGGGWSETDTEVIPVLCQYLSQAHKESTENDQQACQDFFKIVEDCLQRLEGTFAVLIAWTLRPGELADLGVAQATWPPSPGSQERDDVTPASISGRRILPRFQKAMYYIARKQWQYSSNRW